MSTTTTSTSDGLALYHELEQKQRDLTRAIEELKPRGSARSEAECAYRVALKKRIVELRAQGMPVTIIGDVARGDEEIADLRFKRDTADVLYDSAKEAINALKLQIRIINDQISREWGNAGRG